ncbi:hypothetical protein DV495_000988 [Geotrichum candidum]|uniref:Gfd2/YDR514C-like C-terminal domain-containing protein n=1 Tax=Geotrichum candidum TaxID=1173061 RepID=A0A0J9XHH0_GEOCN|nr:hypothetical protein DV454_003340 [Geotrichum candidum]KAI9210937.1 hypothetical protein DS838_004176 [Geotrichum bryndzae]KAF5124546.1 hypothetical protein DV452_000113 [Geotrichum candidum]KAF5135243.1 hypothetical protein DV495_000988 [Geotrichum candidum]KAF7499050.1 hypothetical protein DV113_002923 [Geotrichum candidum]
MKRNSTSRLARTVGGLATQRRASRSARLYTVSAVQRATMKRNRIPFHDPVPEISTIEDDKPLQLVKEVSEKSVNIPGSKPDGKSAEADDKAKATPRPQFSESPEKIAKYKLDLKRALSLIQNRGKVLVGIDLEYFERDHQLLTEIGIAIFNPIVNDPNGTIPDIKTMHIIVKENEAKKNYLTVPDNKNRFSFGKSLKLSLAESKKGVEQILNYYSERNQLVIVGHSVDGDIQMLRDRGFRMPQHEVLDTYRLWRATQPAGPGSLGELLKFFGIPHGVLHNAGNDAFYNIQLALKMLNPVVRKDLEVDSDKRVITWDQPKKKLNWRNKKEVISKSMYQAMLKSSISQLTETASFKPSPTNNEKTS